MPTTTAVSSNYEGKVAGALIGKAYKEGDTLKKGLITLAPNVNFKLNMRRIQYADGRQAYSCGFNPAGSVTLDERVLQPTKLKIDHEICKEDFRATWDEDSFGPSANNDQFAANIRSAIIAEALASHAEEADRMIWQGLDANADEWGGFIELFTADGSVIKHSNGLTSLGAPITKANVTDAFDAATDAVPVALRKKPLVMGVSPDVTDAYYKRLIDEGIANGLGGDANTLPKYGRYMPMEIGGLPDNTIVIYEKKNLLFGTGLAADHNRIVAKDMDDLLLDGNVRFKMVFNGGCQYYNSEEIVWYVSTAA
ncbi:MAG: hypothetical protein AAGF96_05920 [Bacteroidota bacterium]